MPTFQKKLLPQFSCLEDGGSMFLRNWYTSLLTVLYLDTLHIPTDSTLPRHYTSLLTVLCLDTLHIPNSTLPRHTNYTSLLTVFYLDTLHIPTNSTLPRHATHPY
jgi:hypothetical protein